MGTPPDTVAQSDLWFEDGNIILVAGDVAFKVHRGQLERHSEIFRDLFSLPQPLDQPMFQGFPIVQLYDSPSDITFLLRALYDGLYFYKPYANDWQAIEAVLRLSSKYFIEHLRHRCLSRLAVDWPLSLDKWEARERDAVDDKGKYSPRELAPHPILVISLAREVDHLAFVLPSAFYDLSRYGPKKIVSGAVAPLPLTFDSPTSSPMSSPTLPTPDSPTLGSSKDPVYLSHQDAINVLAGREQGQRFMISFIEKSLVDPPISLRCLNQESQSQACRAAFYFIMLNALRSINGIAFGRDADPLFTLSQTEDMLDRTDYADATDPKVLCSLNICAACKSEFRIVIRTARQDVWKSIPSWFGLPGYGELKKHMEDR